jgi:hypothetical protein
MDDDALGTVDGNQKENVRHQFGMNRPEYGVPSLSAAG